MYMVGNKENIKYKIRINCIQLAMIFFFCRDFFYLVFENITNNGAISQIFCIILIYGTFFIGCAQNMNKLKVDAIFLLIGAALLFIATLLIYPEYKYAMLELPSWNIFNSVFTFTSGIFAYLFFRAYSDSSEKLYQTLKYCAYIFIIWVGFRLNSAIINGGMFSRTIAHGVATEKSYDMSLGFRLLFIAIIFSLEFFNTKGFRKYLNGIIVVAAIVLMMVFGSRTAVVSFVVFWVLKILFCEGRKYTIKKIILTLCLAFGIIALTSSTVLLFINGIMEQLGFHSRILSTLIENDITLDLGRTKIWTQCIEMIKERPFFGSGVYADRYLFGIYCHQIFLEILLSFGLVIGTVLILTLIVKSVRTLLEKDNEWKILFVIFFSMCVVRLSFSSSFLVDTNFWALIAIYVNLKKDKLLYQRGLRETTRNKLV